MIRVGIIGLGKMGLLHASILGSLPDVNLVAVCEKGFVVRRFSKKVFENTTIRSQVNQLEGLGLDAIYVTTPAPSHYGIVKQIYSLEIARNVFVEKPLAGNYSQASELCRLAQDATGVTMVGYNRRFAVTFNKARELLDKGVLGDLISFKAYAYSSDFSGARGAQAHSITRGGVITDLGCHAIDLILWLLGEVEVLSGKIDSVDGSGSEDSAWFEVTTLQGVAGSVATSWCMDQYRLPEVRVVLEGSKGTIKADEDKIQFEPKLGSPVTWYRGQLYDNVSFFLGGADYVRENEAFIKSIAGHECIGCDFHAGSVVDRIMEQVRGKARDNGHKTGLAGRG
jgi:predicted dehydrogenase